MQCAASSERQCRDPICVSWLGKAHAWRPLPQADPPQSGSASQARASRALAAHAALPRAPRQGRAFRALSPGFDAARFSHSAPCFASRAPPRASRRATGRDARCDAAAVRRAVAECASGRACVRGARLALSHASACCLAWPPAAALPPGSAAPRLCIALRRCRRVIRRRRASGPGTAAAPLGNALRCCHAGLRSRLSALG